MAALYGQTKSAKAATLKGSAGLLALLAASPALAQIPVEATTPPPGTAAVAAATDQIIVTGTRIARPNIEQSSPVSVVDAVEISFRQPVSAEEFLREVPGTVPSIGPAVNNGTNGSAQLNLRGLGANRNLVLIDGRRVVPASNAGVVDLNLVPVALLERTDVLTGGASSVYGADAVAGVVNFITRRDFTGVDSTSSIGLTEQGDGKIFRTDLTIGANFDEGRGNVVVSIGYSDTDAVQQGSRPWGAESLSSATGRPQGSTTATPATVFIPGPGGGFSGVNPATGTFNLGQPVNYNFNPLNVYQTPLERYSLYTKANYEVTDRLEIFTNAFYVRSVVDQIIAPSGTFFSGGIDLPLNNPFLPAGMRQTICERFTNFRSGTGATVTGPLTPAQCAAAATATAGTPAYLEATNFLIGRRFTEAGPRRTNFTTDTFQFTTGLRGPITEALNWEMFASYGESRRTNTSQGQGVRSRLQQALRAASPTACTNPTGGCVPINLFGADGTITPEMFNFLNVATYNFINQTFLTGQGLVTGELGSLSPFALDGVGVAAGVEYRRFKGQSGGDGISSQPGEVLGAGAPALPIQGGYDTWEAFGEVIVPLVSDRPFFNNLTLEAGGRYSDYSTSGGNWTYKVGGSWAIIPEIRLRGNYARAVRAPNIGELFQPQVTQLSNRQTDPCQLNLPLADARVRALCERQLQLVGAPLNLIGVIPPPVAGQINVTTGGNRDLQPEKADTWTAGVVLQPRFIPGFAVTADWYRITVTDAITSPSQADIIDGCFGQADPNAANCLLIRRNPVTGGLSGANETTPGPFLATSNLGRIRTQGIDVTANMRFDFDPVVFNLAFAGNHTIDGRFQATPTSLDRECVGQFSVACGALQPEWSFNLRGTASFGGTDISLRWRWIDSFETEVASLPLIPAGRPGAGTPDISAVFVDYRRIPAFSYFDLSLSHSVAEQVRLTLTVENLLDKAPPVVGNTIGATAFNSGNTYPATYDALGRKYRVGLNFRF